MAVIMIAEDEHDLNNLIRRHLEEEGHRVLQAFDGQNAARMAAKEHPDLIVLDWMLPRLDGLEVCRRIRRESIAPILMLTARAEEIDRVLGLEIGADDTHVLRLRKKLGSLGERIKTVWGLGYRFAREPKP